MSDISLTSGMRANLLSLQSSVKLLDRTQERLSTGKKVNSALDNPINYFTALDHTTRANDLLAFKDGISESIQTIKAADAAITAITKLITSAKATAEAAKGVVNAESDQQTLTLTAASIGDGDMITIGDKGFTAIMTANAVDASAGEFYAGGSDAQAAASLVAAAAMTAPTSFSVEDDGDGAVTVSQKFGEAMVAADITTDAAAGVVETNPATSGVELTAKQNQYTELLNQIDDLVDDAFYKGKNLLKAGDDMTVKFGNDKTLAVGSFDASTGAGGLDITTLSSTWASEATIDVSIGELENALTTLRIESSKLSSNLSIINARDEWISSVASVLQTGADNLTLADTNEEGANMLMLQTRQSLSTSALSLSAQAAQSVLQLFR